MKFARGLLVLLALAATMSACDDDDLTAPEAQLEGSWDVQTFRYDADDGSSSFDLATVPASQGGPYGILDMTVAADGAFDGTLRLPTQSGVQTFDVGGQIDITGDETLRIDFDAATDALGVLDDFEDGTFELSGNTLTIVLPDVTFDFTQSGSEVDADLTIVGTRS